MRTPTCIWPGLISCTIAQISAGLNIPAPTNSFLKHIESFKMSRLNIIIKKNPIPQTTPTTPTHSTTTGPNNPYSFGALTA